VIRPISRFYENDWLVITMSMIERLYLYLYLLQHLHGMCDTKVL
jgi:hypothetical protein